MTSRAPGSVDRILRAAALLVPRDERSAWVRQWRAEVEFRCVRGHDRGLRRFALSSVRHAWYLRRQEMTMMGWLGDARHAIRSLMRRPGFSVLTVFTLAIGVGAATAIFSLAETFLLRALPMDDSDRLVAIHSTRPDFGWFSVSYHDFRDFTARADLFAGATFYIGQSRDISDEADPERIETTQVAPEFFQVLASPALEGRAFRSDDHDPRYEATAILRASFWERRFGGDPSLLGRPIRLDGVPHTVIGIVDDRHAWPRTTDVWTPLQWGSTVPEYADTRTNHTWQVVARLQPDVRVRDASDAIDAMSAAIYADPDIDERDRGTRAVVVPLSSSEGGENAGSLFALLGAAVFFVLAIACMNASGMLMTRAAARTRELSLRAALGAGRRRLTALLFGESLALAIVGGALGVGLGSFGVRRAWTMMPPEITGLAEIQLNGTVLVAGVAISLVAALMAGLVPALRASRSTLADSLRDGSVRTGSSVSNTRLRRGFVVGQLALSLALLIAAGLTIRGFQRQIATDPGFDADGLLSFTVRLPGGRYADEASVEAYFESAVRNLVAQPGIIGATSTSRLPLGAGGMSLGRAFIFDGATPPPDGPEFFGSWVEVDPAYFDALGVAPVEGRAFTADDRPESPLVAIVNEQFANTMSPDRSMVGRVIRSFYDENLPRTVVGVMPDVQFRGVARDRKAPLVLVPRAQSARRSMAFLVRTDGAPEDQIATVRRVMEEIDGDVALDELQSLRDAHAADLAGIRFLTSLFAVFGALALGLAVTGVYGLVSYSVSQRRSEIGVRMAMGASRSAVRTAVIRESGLLAVAGLGIGLVLAYALGRVLAVGMDGIAIVQPTTYVAGVMALGLAVLAASWVPATRATRVDPVEALRSD